MDRSGKIIYWISQRLAQLVGLKHSFPVPLAIRFQKGSKVNHLSDSTSLHPIMVSSGLKEEPALSREAGLV